MSLHASMIELLEEENLKQEQWQIQDGSKVGNGHRWYKEEKIIDSIHIINIAMK